SSTCVTIDENGVAAGPITLGTPASATLASVFCIGAQRRPNWMARRLRPDRRLPARRPSVTGLRSAPGPAGPGGFSFGLSVRRRDAARGGEDQDRKLGG